jgi:hypothetical protein
MLTPRRTTVLILNMASVNKAPIVDLREVLRAYGSASRQSHIKKAQA